MSVDSLVTEELLRGGRAGADYLLSLKESTLAVADEVGSIPVILPGIDVFDPNPDSNPAMGGMAVGEYGGGLAPERSNGDDPSKNARPAPWSRSEGRRAAPAQPRSARLSPWRSGSCS